MIWKFLMKIYSLEIFPFEDLFMEIFLLDFWKFFKKICSWRFFLWNMVSEIFPLKNGDFSFWRFVHGDFSLKIYSGDWTFEKNLMKICSGRFFLEDLFFRDFSIDVLEIFIEDLFIGDLWFWRFFLWKMENFPFENGDFFF